MMCMHAGGWGGGGGGGGGGGHDVHVCVLSKQESTIFNCGIDNGFGGFNNAL